MKLKVLLPFQVFAEIDGVKRIVGGDAAGFVRAVAAPARLRGGAGSGNTDL